MKVENLVVAEKDEKKQRKFLMVILAVLIALIFSLTVSIVVVILTRGNNGENEPRGGGWNYLTKNIVQRLRIR